jgi:hypothetical protein
MSASTDLPINNTLPWDVQVDGAKRAKYFIIIVFTHLGFM